MRFFVQAKPFIQIALSVRGWSSVLSTRSRRQVIRKGAADHAADGGKGIGPAGNFIPFKKIARMQGNHIAARIGIDRTAIAAIDLADVIIQIGNHNIVNFFIDPFNRERVPTKCLLIRKLTLYTAQANQSTRSVIQVEIKRHCGSRAATNEKVVRASRPYAST